MLGIYVKILFKVFLLDKKVQWYLLSVSQNTAVKTQKGKNPKHQEMLSVHLFHQQMFAAVLFIGTKGTTVSPTSYWEIASVSQTMLLQECAK